MNILYDLSISGRLSYSISAYLNERQFRVLVGDTYLNPSEQEMGVPQGSILSVTLSSVRINDIVKSVCPSVECFLYNDNFRICCRSKHMYNIARQLQQVLNNFGNGQGKVVLYFLKPRPNACISGNQEHSIIYANKILHMLHTRRKD